MFVDHGGHRISVVPWVSDQRALDGPMTSAHWRAYGAVLAAVHAAPVTGSSAGCCRRAVPRTLDRGRDPRDGRAAARPGRGRPRGSAVRGAGGVWSAAADRLGVLTSEIERGAVDPLARPGSGVVCHGDPHLGNLLLGADGQVWLIDWDDAVLAPVECDLMFVLGGVLAFAPITAEQQKAVLAGYGNTDIDPARLAWFLAVRALDDLSDWTRQALERDAEASDRSRAARIVRGLVSPVGLVTLADTAMRGLDRRRGAGGHRADMRDQ
ncbi:phosphotransferase [Micromonospora sp. M12]